MEPLNEHPFSDLTSEQVQRLIRAARIERAQAMRSFFAALFRWRRKDPLWPTRQRDAQVWPPKNVPALSLTVYR
jgi:hypothetical protein